MAETLDTKLGWAQDSLSNSDIIAAHEKTMFLHRVARVGAIATKDMLLPGEEQRGDPQAIEWGLIHSLGPVREWTSTRWRSEPVYLGETEENDLGLTHEYMTLGVAGIVDTRTKRSLRGINRTEELMGEDYTITRHLGDSSYQPTQLIDYPGKLPAHVDRNYTCRDVIPCALWSPQDQIEDYESRVNQISVFMDELNILANAANIGYDLTRHFDAGHVSSQVLEVADIPNQSTQY